MLPAAQAVLLHAVAVVVPLRRVELVPVDLAVARDLVAVVRLSSEEHPALGAPDEMLQQVEHLGVPLGPAQPLLLEGLRPIPGLLVHQRRDRDLYPGLLRLRVDPRPVFRRNMPGPAKPPDALVGLVAQNAVNARFLPPRVGLAHGDFLLDQLPGDGRRAHPLVDVLAEDAPHDLGLGLVNLRPAVVAGPVAVGERAGRHAALLGRPAPAHGRALPEVVQLDLSDGRHQAEGLHVDGVHDGLDPYLVGLDDLHESGGGEHAPAEAVRLPADDGVEQTLLGVGQHPLELGALLRPAPADLLVARGDGQPLALAVGLHLDGLLGEGGLVLLGLALVRNAGVDGRPLTL